MIGDIEEARKHIPAAFVDPLTGLKDEKTPKALVLLLENQKRILEHLREAESSV